MIRVFSIIWEIIQYIQYDLGRVPKDIFDGVAFFNFTISFQFATIKR